MIRENPASRGTETSAAQENKQGKKRDMEAKANMQYQSILIYLIRIIVTESCFSHAML